ncbi:MAG TPA: DUF5615 family PIN-like protein [Bryobacteraceae bacterium]|nr:DUF5615 family PIN-like protein [Bryobacteraceae bacterium]
MKFKIDENLPSELAGDLAQLGHEADTVAGEGLADVLALDLAGRLFGFVENS